MFGLRRGLAKWRETPQKYLLQHCDGENNWQQHKNGEAETIEGNDEIKVGQ